MSIDRQTRIKIFLVIQIAGYAVLPAAAIMDPGLPRKIVLSSYEYLSCFC